MEATPNDQVWRLEGCQQFGVLGRARYRMWAIWAATTLALSALTGGAWLAVWLWAGLGVAAPVAAFVTAFAVSGSAAHAVCARLSPHYQPTTRLDYWVNQAIAWSRTPRPAPAAVDVPMPQPTRSSRRVTFTPSLPDNARRTPYDCDDDCPSRQAPRPPD